MPIRRRKLKKNLYHLAGKDNIPITREDLEEYHEFSMFFVSSDGLVIPITPYTDHKTLSRIPFGKYMYKEDLEKLIFTDEEV